MYQRSRIAALALALSLLLGLVAALPAAAGQEAVATLQVSGMT